MTTKRAKEAAVAPGGATGGVAVKKAPRKTVVRTRCSGGADLQRVVTEQMTAAMPYIVAANVERAIAGSLIHTKWLWGVMEEADAVALLAARELVQEQETLGMLLLRELKQETPPE